jgi:hypothetical protein
MKKHDFSYNYSDDFKHWRKHNIVRADIIFLKTFLVQTKQGRKLIEMAEKRYGYV